MRLIDRRVESNKAPSATLVVPKAAVYVVEAHGERHATEGFLGAILAHYPKARIVVMAEDFTESNSFPLLRQGAKGLLKYSEVGVYLPRALREVASGGFWVPRALLSKFVDSTLETARRAHPVPIGTNLSPREKEVADLLLENLANKEIASRLNVSERTAKFHVSNLLAKYKVQRRADLILLFVQSAARIGVCRRPSPQPAKWWAIELA